MASAAPMLPVASSADEGWELVGDHLVLSQSSDDDLVFGLDRPVDEETGPRPKFWWAELLHNHATSLGMVVPTLASPLTLMSGCTGCFAEGFVLEENPWC